MKLPGVSATSGLKAARGNVCVGGGVYINLTIVDYYGEIAAAIRVAIIVQTYRDKLQRSSQSYSMVKWQVSYG